MKFRKIEGKDLIFQLLSIFWAFFLNFRLHFSGQPIHHIFELFQRNNYKFSLHFSGKSARNSAPKVADRRALGHPDVRAEGEYGRMTKSTTIGDFRSRVSTVSYG